MDRSAERCTSCGLDSRRLLLLRARLDGFEQRLAALEIAVGVGARGVNLARHATRRAANRTHRVKVAVLSAALPLAMLLLVHSALMIVSGELNPRSERRRPVA